MIEIGKQYKTRDGRDARVLCVDSPDKLYRVVAVVRNGNNWDPVDFTAEGRESADQESGGDLVEVKPEYTRWMICAATHGYDTREDAVRAIPSWLKNPAVVAVTFRKGDGI
jgi:hypothetical protein